MSKSRPIIDPVRAEFTDVCQGGEEGNRRNPPRVQDAGPIPPAGLSNAVPADAAAHPAIEKAPNAPSSKLGGEVKGSPD